MLSSQTLTQTIRGTVVDSESKFPLADAMVVCDAQQAFTDEFGQFSFEVEIGRKVVAVQLFGYEPKKGHDSYETNTKTKKAPARKTPHDARSWGNKRLLPGTHHTEVPNNVGLCFPTRLGVDQRITASFPTHN